MTTPMRTMSRRSARSSSAAFPTLHLVGRNGMHKYNNQDHSMMTAMLCVKNILAGKQLYDLWEVNEDAEYHESGEHSAAAASGERLVPARVKPAWRRLTPDGSSRHAVNSALRPQRGSASWCSFWSPPSLLPIVLGLGMTKGLSHDEHQHVAAGALIAREGLMPYRDFPHFHTPYLAYVYARHFSILRSPAALGADGLRALRHRHSGGDRERRLWLLSRARDADCCAGLRGERDPGADHAALHRDLRLRAGITSLPSSSRCSPSSRTSRASNEPAGWFAASGMLLGLAIGTRITYAPLVAPFGLALLLYPGPIAGTGGDSSRLVAGSCSGFPG